MLLDTAVSNNYAAEPREHVEGTAEPLLGAPRSPAVVKPLSSGAGMVKLSSRYQSDSALLIAFIGCSQHVHLPTAIHNHRHVVLAIRDLGTRKNSRWCCSASINADNWRFALYHSYHNLPVSQRFERPVGQLYSKTSC